MASEVDQGAFELSPARSDSRSRRSSDSASLVPASLVLVRQRERGVLQLRFGFEGGRTRTLEEVGREFNVTRERIRHIMEAKALRKLRHPSRSRKLKDYLE